MIAVWLVSETAIRQRWQRLSAEFASASTPAEPSNPAISVPREAPDPALTRSLSHESALAAGESRSVQAGASTSHRSWLQGAYPADSAADAGVAFKSHPNRRKLAGADTDGLS